MAYKDYDGGVDYAFLKAMDIKVVKHQPWQLGLTHPDLKGKYVWYPRKGTLMFEWEFGMPHSAKIGQTGEFCAGGGYKENWKEGATEMVYQKIMEKIMEQQGE